MFFKVNQIKLYKSFIAFLFLLPIFLLVLVTSAKNTMLAEDADYDDNYYDQDYNQYDKPSDNNYNYSQNNNQANEANQNYNNQNYNYNQNYNQSQNENYNNQNYNNPNNNNYYNNNYYTNNKDTPVSQQIVSPPPNAQTLPEVPSFNNANVQIQEYNADVTNTQEFLQNGDNNDVYVSEINPVQDYNNINFNDANNSNQNINYINTERMNAVRAVGIDINPDKLKRLNLPNEFAGAPINPGSLGYLTVGTAPNFYVIQDGDTLFDICDQFLDEPEYWPKLWSMNPNIINPHFIWPGMVLRFYPGDETHPPFLEIDDHQSLTPVDIDGEVVIKDLVKAPLYDQIKENPQVTQWAQMMGLDDVPDLDDSLITDFNPLKLIQHKVNRNSFIYEKRPKILAKIVGNLEGEFDIFKKGVLKARSNLNQSDRYSVVRYHGKLRNPYNNKFVGYQYSNLASIKIIDYDRNSRNAVFQLDKIIAVVGVNDLIVKYRDSVHIIPPINYKKAKVADVSATVVGFDNTGARIAEKHSVVVLNNSGGLQKSQLVNFYKKRKLVSGYLSGFDSFYKYGLGYVLETNKSSAVALVIEASNYVLIGDRTEPKDESKSLIFSKID